MMENIAREVEVGSPQWAAITNWENEGGAILPKTRIIPSIRKRTRSLSGMGTPPKQPPRPVCKSY